MMAKEFNFLRKVAIGSCDFFGACIIEELEEDGDGIALVLIAHQEEMAFLLAESFLGDFDAKVVLLTSAEPGGGIGEFDEIFGISFFAGRFEEFEDFFGGD